MTETYEYEGYWWLPEDADSQIPEANKRLSGKLTISEGSPTLDVLGDFGHAVLRESDTQPVYAAYPSGQPKILGVTSTGQPVTLLSGRVSQSAMRFPGIATTSYAADVALIGAWFTQGEDVTLDEFVIRTSDLDTWVAKSGFKQTIGGRTVESGAFQPTGIQIEYEPPAPILIALDGGDEARITFGYTSLGLLPVTLEAGVSQTASLHYRFGEPSGLNEIGSKISQLRNFLSLAVGRRVAVRAVSGYKDDFVHPKTGTREPIEVFFPIRHNAEPTGRALHPTEMLFTLPQAEPDISSVLRAWFAAQTRFGPVFDLYFGTLYHPDLYLDVKFLLNAQAVETYDFRRREPFELSPEEHKLRVSQIIEATPVEWREWLQMRLASSNYRVLDQRIRDVLAELPEITAKVVGTSEEEITQFVRAVKRSRNYYTHYSPDLEAKAAEGADLYVLTVQLQAIIEASLLRELGFSPETIDHILDRVQRYARVSHYTAGQRQDDLVQ